MANVAVLAYQKSILAIKMCTPEIWEVMTKFQDKMVTNVHLKTLRIISPWQTSTKEMHFLMKSILSSFH